ncbi:MAG: hypothetical protein DRP32_01395 [Thermotogae bacterium]|nr:MAG: hypothetical protein DRP32_01395 [Thermotogota bacterium]
MRSGTPVVLFYTESEEEKRIAEKFFINYQTRDCTGLEEEKLYSVITGKTGNSKSQKLDLRGYSFMIFHNIKSKEIPEILKHFRKVSKSNWIFATTTENNLSWTLKDLFHELVEEHENMHKYNNSSRKGRKA